MRNSRIAAVLGAAAIVTAGIAAVPALAVTAPAPTINTAINTLALIPTKSYGVLEALVASHVTIGVSGAAFTSVSGTGGHPVYNISLPSKLTAAGLTHTGALFLSTPGHSAVISNLTIVPATASVYGTCHFTGCSKTAQTKVFGLVNIVSVTRVANGHTWRMVTAVLNIPNAGVAAALSGALGINPNSPIFPAGTPIATATAWILVR